MDTAFIIKENWKKVKKKEGSYLHAHLYKYIYIKGPSTRFAMYSSTPFKRFVKICEVLNSVALSNIAIINPLRNIIFRSYLLAFDSLKASQTLITCSRLKVDCGCQCWLVWHSNWSSSLALALRATRLPTSLLECVFSICPWAMVWHDLCLIFHSKLLMRFVCKKMLIFFPQSSKKLK